MVSAGARACGGGPPRRWRRRQLQQRAGGRRRAGGGAALPRLICETLPCLEVSRANPTPTADGPISVRVCVVLGACEGACERPVMRGAVLLLIVAQGAALPSSRPIEKFDSAWLSEFLGNNVESLPSATVAILEPLMASLNTMVPLSARGITFAGASYGDAKAKEGKECKKAKISIDLPLPMSATCMKQCKAYAESKGYEKEFCCEFDRAKSSSGMCKISEDGKAKYKSGDKTVFIFEPGEEETYDYDDYDDDEATPPPPSPSPPSPSSSNWYVSTTSDKRCGYPDKQATLKPLLDVAESCKLVRHRQSLQ